ncbi:MAG: exonuclease V subunit gamma [Burkholderiaceae bacterium]|nr:MAG: exonuclease V subunit gamma [Burkholderiaceae bacterium]
MTLSIRLDNDALRLADALAERLRVPQSDPLAEDVVVVPSLGVGRWLQQRLADRFGVSALLRLEFPGQLLWRVLGAVLPDLAPRSPFDASRAQWVVLDLFDRLPADDPAFAPLRRRVARAGPADRLALAREIAATFDRYLAYRRLWLAGWDRSAGASEAADAPVHDPSRGDAMPGDPVDDRAPPRVHGVAGGPGRAGDLGPDEAWQRWMWRALVQALGVGARHPFDRFLDAVAQAQRAGPAALAALRARVGIERVCLWGALPMAPEQLQLYGRLSALLDVHLFVPDPCREFWQDVTDARLRARFAQERPDEPWLLDDGPRLLGEWGKSQRDTLIGVAELEERAGVQADDAFRSRAPAPPVDALRALQAALFARDDAVWSELPADCDPSALQVHACHGLMRQVEVLHDRLLDCFATMDGLRPGDVVVFCTDLDTAAPCVQAVFGGAPAGRHLPFSLSGRAVETQPGVAAVLGLLELARGRLPLPALVQLLENPAIVEALGLEADDPQRLSDWLVAAGIHWGVDGLTAVDTDTGDAGGVEGPVGPDGSLVPLGPDGADEHPLHAWRSGLDRLLAGAVMSDDIERFDDLILVGGAGGQASALYGRLLVLVRALARYAREARRPAPVRVWAQRLSALVAELFGAVHAHLDEIRCVRDALATVVETSALRPDLAVDAQVFEAALRAELTAVPPAALPGGAITFCPVGALRGVPYRVVVMLGADEAAFPRRHRLPEYDLMRRHPWRGDRIAGIEDRGVFLDLVLAARDRLMLLYDGRNARDNSATNPSLLVTDLIAYVRDCLRSNGRDAASCLIERQHPLQPFGPEGFRVPPPGAGDDGRLRAADARSFAAQWLEAARRIDAPIAARRPPDPLVPACDFAEVGVASGADTAPAGIASEAMRIDELVDALWNPARAWLRDGLGIEVVRGQALPDESEPLDAAGAAGEPAPLAAVIARLASGADAEQVAALMAIDPALPAGTAGTLASQALLERARALLESTGVIDAPLVERALTTDVPMPDGTRVRVTGSVRVRADSGGGPIVLSAYPINGRSVIEAWCAHLLWQAAAGDITAADDAPTAGVRMTGAPAATLLAGPGAVLSVSVPDDPRAQLAWAIALTRRVRQQPTMLLPKVVWALYGRGAVADDVVSLEPAALGRARSVLEGGWRADGASRGVLDDPWVAALFREGAPGLDPVLAVSLPIYRRIFDCFTPLTGSIAIATEDGTDAA